MDAKYSRYFGEVLKQHGIPSFSVSQFQRMMNIVYLEGKLSAQEDFLKCMAEKDGQREYARLKFRNEHKLGELTRNKSPHKLVIEFVDVSHKENSTEFDHPWPEYERG